MEKHNLFHTIQCGFRSKHSCHTALSAMCDIWLSPSDRSRIVRAVFIDFKKAFALVDHTILQQKLRENLNNHSVIPFFQSYLPERSQCVCENGKLSPVCTIQTGVPQGSILGPLLFRGFFVCLFVCYCFCFVLFCIFINDIPLHIHHKKSQTLCLLTIHLLTQVGKL